MRRDHPLLAFGVPLCFAAAVAAAIHAAWAPPQRTYLDHVPISAVFAGLVWDRFADRTRPAPIELGVDALAVALAGLRAIAPPLPFLSGHALLTVYPLLTRSGWPLRVLAGTVLVHVLYDKLFAMPGAASLLAGTLMAGLLAWLRRHSRTDHTAHARALGR
jgi:hypothetical protein